MALVLITILVVFSLLCPSRREPYLHPLGPLTISQKNYHWKLLDNGTGSMWPLSHIQQMLLWPLMHILPTSIWLPHSYAADARFSIYAPYAYAADVHLRPQPYAADTYLQPWYMLSRYGFKPVSPYLQPSCTFSRHHKKHLWMISIIRSCCSSVILLSDGRQSPLRKISAPTSIPDPFM